MQQKTGIIQSWSQLVRKVETVYGLFVYEDLSYTPFKLTQEELVTHYYSNFTALANGVDGISPTALLPYFISGLKKEIQGDVISWKSDSLTTTFTLAKLYEERYSKTSWGLPKKTTFPQYINSIFGLQKPAMGPIFHHKLYQLQYFLRGHQLLQLPHQCLVLPMEHHPFGK